jgi:hypothetical protein
MILMMKMVQAGIQHLIEGVDLGDERRSKNLYEEDSSHYTSSSNESIDPLCDIPHHVDEITLHELENRLLVTEEKIVQVLTRVDGAHKFIEDLMWKTQMEERQKGIADGVTSTQLCIIKEALEQMKSIICSCSWIGTLLLSSLKTRKGRLRSFVTNLVWHALHH